MPKQRYVTPYIFTMIHLGLGEKDQAMDFLEKTYEDRDGYNLAFTKVDPFSIRYAATRALRL